MPGWALTGLKLANTANSRVANMSSPVFFIVFMALEFLGESLC